MLNDVLEVHEANPHRSDEPATLPHQVSAEASRRRLRQRNSASTVTSLRRGEEMTRLRNLHQSFGRQLVSPSQLVALRDPEPRGTGIVNCTFVVPRNFRVSYILMRHVIRTEAGQALLRRIKRWSEPEELPCDMVYPTDPAQGTRRHVAYIGEPCRLGMVSC
jgi:hypothetical protein